MNLSKAIFLDRDGVINEEMNYLHQVEDCRFLPQVFESLQKASSFGYKLIIVTNQAGIAKGKFTDADYQALTGWILKRLGEKQIPIDGVYHCPHHPESSLAEYKQSCSCRKPKPGMLLQAAREHHLNLSQSYMIGDKTTDILAGKTAGCKTILVKTGYGGKDQLCPVEPDYTADNLSSAIDLILSA